MTPRPGCVAEFLQGNQVQLAWVLEESSGKLRLVTLTKREVKMPAARLLPWTGPVHEAQASREDIQHALDEHATRRAELEAQVDVAELWEMAQGEVEEARAQWFAQLVWQDPDPDQIAAVGRLLLEAKTRFKFQPPAFLVHPADKVELLESRQAEELWREKVITAGQDLFQVPVDAQGRAARAGHGPGGARQAARPAPGPGGRTRR